MPRKAVLAILCTIPLVALVLTGCGGGKGGAKQSKALNPEAVAINYTSALFEGNVDLAKSMSVANPPNKDRFIANTEQAASVFSQYEAKGYKVVSSRSWGGVGAPDYDRRIEVQFEFRKRGSTEEHEFGTVYVRMISENGLWGVGDVMFAYPDK